MSRLSIIDEFFEKAKLDWEYTKYQKGLTVPKFLLEPVESEDEQLESTEENPEELVSTEEE